MKLHGVEAPDVQVPLELCVVCALHSTSAWGLEVELLQPLLFCLATALPGLLLGLQTGRLLLSSTLVVGQLYWTWELKKEQTLIGCIASGDLPIPIHLTESI